MVKEITMRKIISVLLLVTLITLSVTACGGGSAPPPGTRPPLPEVPVMPEFPEIPEMPEMPEMPEPITETSETTGGFEETFSEPTFEYSVTWLGKEISVGMRLFEVLDLGFEYSRQNSREFYGGVDVETAQEIASQMVEYMDIYRTWPHTF